MSTSIEDAIFADDAAAAQKLITSKAVDPNGERPDKTRFLCFAASAGAVGVIGALLDAGAKIDAPNSDDRAYTPLICAVREEKPKAVALLLERGADKNAGDSRGGGPLLHAAIVGSVELAQSLLAAGANPAQQTARKETAVHYIANMFSHSSYAVGFEILPDGSKRAIENKQPARHAAIVELLLERGVNPNDFTSYGYTALHCAGGTGRADLLALMLKHGGDVRAKNAKGYTPLHAAADGGHVDALGVLLDAGADIDAQDSSGFCALHGAVIAKSADAVKLLVKRGAKKELKATEGYDVVQVGDTPLDAAKRTESAELIAAFGG